MLRPGAVSRYAIWQMYGGSHGASFAPWLTLVDLDRGLAVDGAGRWRRGQAWAACRNGHVPAE
jgi:hypothetical protein